MNDKKTKLDEIAQMHFGVNYKQLGSFGKWEVEDIYDAQQISLSDFEEINSEHAPDELKTFVDPLITPMHISRKHFNDFYLDEEIYEYYDEVKLELKNGWFILALKRGNRLVSFIKCMGEAPSFLLNLTQ